MTSKLIEALNKCETQKSYENVRYTLIDDELRAYIEEALERLETLEKENKKWREIVGCDLCEALGREILLEQNEKLKKAIRLLKLMFEFEVDVETETIYCCLGDVSLSGADLIEDFEELKEVLNNE